MDSDSHVLFTPEQSSRFWQLIGLLRQTVREAAAIETAIHDLVAIGQDQADNLVEVPAAARGTRAPGGGDLVDLATRRAQKPPAGGA